MESMEKVLRPPSCQHKTPPLMMLNSALYLFSTSKVARMSDILLHAGYDDLFNHFTNKLLADPDWAETKAGFNYFYWLNRNIRVTYILEGEANRFATWAYNLIHPQAHIREISPYK